MITLTIRVAFRVFEGFTDAFDFCTKCVGNGYSKSNFSMAVRLTYKKRNGLGI